MTISKTSYSSTLDYHQVPRSYAILPSPKHITKVVSMNPVSDFESLAISKELKNETTNEKRQSIGTTSLSNDISSHQNFHAEDEAFPLPTDEELVSLRRVSGPIPWIAFTIAFVEFCERFSYYGTTAVFVNFIQQPLPEGSDTGAGFDGQSGALGMGQRARSACSACILLASSED